MSNRSISWTAALRDVRSDRQPIPRGLLGARAQIQGFARYRARPLVTPAGAFDRAAIMAAASYAADSLQERHGLTRREAMSTALKAAWQAAKMARSATAH